MAIGEYQFFEIMETKKLEFIIAALVSSPKYLLLQLLEIKAVIYEKNANPSGSISTKADISEG